MRAFWHKSVVLLGYFWHKSVVLLGTQGLPVTVGSGQPPRWVGWPVGSSRKQDSENFRMFTPDWTPAYLSTASALSDIWTRRTSRAVWWMRVDIVWAMSSISAFLTDLKRIQTPRSLFWDFEADKPLQPVGQAAEFKFESKFEPLPVIWQSLPKAAIEAWGLEGKIDGQALGAALRHGLGGSDGRGAFPSRRQSRQARLRKRFKRFLCFVDIGPWRQNFVSLGNEIPMESAKSCCRPKHRPSLR